MDARILLFLLKVTCIRSNQADTVAKFQGFEESDSLVSL